MEKEDEKPRSKTKKNVKIIQKLWYFFDLNALSKSTIFFKINLYKVVPKCKALEGRHCHRIILKAILDSCRLCKKNQKFISDVKTSDDVMNHYCFFAFFPRQEYFSCCNNLFPVLRIFLLL